MSEAGTRFGENGRGKCLAHTFLSFPYGLEPSAEDGVFLRPRVLSDTLDDHARPAGTLTEQRLRVQIHWRFDLSCKKYTLAQSTGHIPAS